MRSQTAAENVSNVLAHCYNQHTGINTVAPAALQHLFDATKLSQWARQQNLDAELGWRLTRDGPLFTTTHRIIPEGMDTTGPGVTFFGNMAWTHPITAYVTRFHQYAAEQEAALSRSLSANSAYPNQQNHVQPPLQRIRDLNPAVSRERGAAQGLPSGTVGRATMSHSRLQDRRRLQVSQRLVRAQQQYAREEYLSTGNTSEILRAMEQSQRVGAAAFQQRALDEGADEWGDF